MPSAAEPASHPLRSEAWPRGGDARTHPIAISGRPFRREHLPARRNRLAYDRARGVTTEGVDVASAT
jgi:hypothetical protein